MEFLSPDRHLFFYITTQASLSMHSTGSVKALSFTGEQIRKKEREETRGQQTLNKKQEKILCEQTTPKSTGRECQQIASGGLRSLLAARREASAVSSDQRRETAIFSAGHCSELSETGFEIHETCPTPDG